MRKILKRMTMIALCAMLVGCGGTETKEQTTEESQTVQVSQQVSQEETKINIPKSAIIGMWENSYVDIQQEGGKYHTKIYLSSVDASEYELIYFTIGTMTEIVSRKAESNFCIITSSGEYTLNTDTQKLEDGGFPEEWNDILKDSNDDISIIKKNITAAFSDSFDDWAKYSFDKYLDDVIIVEEESETENQKETEVTNNEEDTYNKQLDEENGVNILAKKTYNIENDTFNFSLGQSENGDYKFTLLCEIADKSDACITHISLNALFNSDDENIKALIETMHFSYSIFIGDGTVLMRTKSLLYLSKDGEMVDVNDYFSADWISSEDFQESDYGTQVANFLVDFMENE